MKARSSLKQFSNLVASSLDIEELLRVTMERMMARLGPAQIVCYLVEASGDYAVGAYVRHNIADEVSEMLFDHWADIIPGRFEGEVLAHPIGYENQRRYTDGDPNLKDLDLLLLGIDHTGQDCRLGVMQVARPQPINDDELNEIRDIVTIFRDHLQKILRVHNRLKPKKGKGMGDLLHPGDDEDEEQDVA